MLPDIPNYLKMLLGGVPAQEDGNEGDEGGSHPGDQQHYHCHPKHIMCDCVSKKVTE